MKELYKFRQFLTEGVIEDEIASRIRKLGKENGIANADIEKYVDELSGFFEPDAYKNTTDAELLDDLKLYMDLAEGKLLKEDITSKAISVLKNYEGEVEGVEGYIKYLMNTSDDISSSIQAIADDLDRDNDTSDSLRRDLEKLSLAEGKLLKENEEQGYTLYTTNVEYDNGKTGYMYQLVNSEDGEENEIGFDQLHFVGKGDASDPLLVPGKDFKDYDQYSYQEEEVSAEEAMKIYNELK